MSKINSKFLNLKFTISILFGVLLLNSCTTNTNMLPVLETMPSKDVTVFSATSGGSIITDGGSRIIKQGICWDSLSNPTIKDNIIVDSLDKSAFIVNISPLKSNKKYYVRAFATNYVGTSYGKEESFTTLSLSAPILNTSNVTGISDISAICGGTIISDGNSPITACGLCWSNVPTPTTALSTKTVESNKFGDFVSKISGLSAVTTYYVRAYATNSNGTTYGREILFTTAPVNIIITVPTLFSNVITTITNSSAVAGGVITSDGGSTVTARGVCFSTTPNASINSQTTSDGNGAGSFISNLTGLTASTTYYVRAYATNSQGTAYGSEYSFTTAAITLPVLTTSSATGITSGSAVSGGKISSDGGATITKRGICWSTDTEPTIELSTKTLDGTGSGNFSSNLTGLKGLTTYYVRAYATNSKGTAYGNEISLVTAASLTVPILYTNVLSAITINSGVSGGVISSDGGSSITSRGVCWSTSTEPTIALTTKTTDGIGLGAFTSNITGLAPNTTYYVRAYATNNTGTGYGLEYSFTTAQLTPTVLTTTVASNIGSSTAESGGNITSDGGATITGRGICWSTSSGPTISLSTKTTDGSGSGIFVSNLTGLTGSTTYYVRAYATNSRGTTYGNEISLITAPSLSVPILFTNVLSAITTNSAVSGGTISSDGGSTITSRGVCWSTTTGPTIALTTKTTDGTGLGAFTSNITGLAANTTYYVRAYATNNAGTGYGLEYSFTTTQPTSAVLTTTVVSNISSTTAVSGGNITSDGGAAVTARGVCFGTSPNPTVASTHTTDGTGTGTFVSNIIGLTPSITYHIRSYATTIAGTVYGNDVSFVTSAPPVGNTTPIEFTTAASSITSNSATSGGNVVSDGGLAVTARGVCWSISTGPTIALSTKTSDGTGTGVFTSTITGLLSTTTYYVRAYATNSLGTSYGSEISFTTLANLSLPGIITNSVSSITTTTAVSGGNITSNGNSTITASGVCWSTTANPTTANFITNDLAILGTYSSNLTGLLAATTYHVRAYATNSVGTAYGNDISFTTATPLSLPTVTTTAASSITTSTASSGGNVTSDGGATVTARGICWSTITGPTISNSTTSNASGTGIFTSNISGLAASTTYYLRAYATNSVGTAYGSEISFTTLAGVSLPGIITSSVTSITTTTAVSGGNITSNGNSIITASGVCWSTTVNPTTANFVTSDLAIMGAYSSNLTGLLPATTYHVRAYATNSVGTAYGNDISFTTSTPLTAPTVTTTAASAITTSTASSGGNVTSNGGATVTARGVCWSTTSGPTINNSITSDASGTGIFISNLSGLAASTTYYLRAYATNSVGTSYGSEISFTTAAPTATLPVLTTTAATAIAGTTATSGGNISSDGGSPVTARGVCWSTSSGATVSLSTQTADGTGTGSFTSSITGLTGSTLYYVRGYATNAVGTAYGNEVTFTTSAVSANTTGTLTVSVLTVAPGGSYAPKNVVAIWIQTNAGVFVKSLLVYAAARKTDLTTWYPNSSGNVVNATTGATQSSNAVRTCTWNGTDVNGAVVLDGTYKVCMNTADGKTTFASFPFVKGPTAVTLTPANVTGFSNISIGWVH